MTNRPMSGSWIPAGAFLLGAVTGGIAAILLAPFAGEETRSRLRSGFINGKSTAKRRTQELATDILDHGEQLVDAGKKKIADEVHRIDSALQAGKAAYQRGAAAQA
jgi:gas vesicle protein